MLGFGKQNVHFGKMNEVGNIYLLEAERQRDARKKRIGEAWRRYEGTHPKPLLPTGTDPKGRDNTTINLARRAVDIAAFYLFGKDLRFQVGDEAESDEDLYLKAVWEANRQATLLLEFATSAGISGDGYLRLYPAGNDNEFPRIVPLDALLVDVDTEPDDVSKVRRYLVQFTAVDLTERVVEARRHRIERQGRQWEIVEEVSRGDSTQWREVMRESWPYAFAPIFHCKNLPNPHSFFGRSDIEEDALALNDAVNFVVSNINRILRVHGHPQRFVAGMGKPDSMDGAVDAVLWIPDGSGKVGTVPYVQELVAHNEQFRRLMEAYHALTNIPEIATGKMESVGELSGLALQILYGPLLQLVAVKRKFYGEMLVELNRAILALGGLDAGLPVVNLWPDILPTDAKQQADTALAWQEAGVSKDTTLKQAGFDSDVEAEKRQAEAEEARRAFDRGQVPPNDDPFNQNQED